jgi:hypothetical protein
MATSIFRFYRFLVSGVAIAAATLSLSAAGQATINPLYLDGIDKCVDKTSMEEVKLPSAGIYTADKADKAKWIAAKACFLAKLNAKFPIYPKTEAEMSLDYYSLLRKRLAPESDEKDKIRQLPGQRFKDDANALHYRRTLLRFFETVRSGGTSDFVVVPYRDAGKAEGKTSASFCDGFTPASSKPYVPLSNPEKDDEMIRYFLRKDSMDFHFSNALTLRKRRMTRLRVQHGKIFVPRHVRVWRLIYHLPHRECLGWLAMLKILLKTRI